MKRVALECQNLRLSKGTGIATYARTLASELRGLGYSPLGIVGLSAPLNKKSGVLAEAEFFDAPGERKRRRSWLERYSIQKLLSDPLGARAQRVLLPGSVVGAGQWREEFDELHGVLDLDKRAESHLETYGNLLEIRNVGQVDVFHATQAIAIKMRRVPNLYTIHDIIPLKLPYATLTDKEYFYELTSTILKDADKIVTVSEFSKQDIVKTFKISEDRIVNTYQSVSLPQHLLDLPEDAVVEAVELSFGLKYKGYFLFIGALEPKKNVSGLIEGYSASGASLPLVLAGGLGWQYEDDLKRISNERFLSYRIHDGVIRQERAVQRLDYVSRSSLVMLLRGARALVFPSLYEGFGLPVLEAMLAGTPVITSNTSSLPEIAGDAAEYVSPTDHMSIARAIRKIEKDDDLCAELVSRGRSRAQLFSPASYRKRLEALYSEVC